MTRPVYRPFQHADAVRVLRLGHGCGIGTVGLPGGRTVRQHLQEVRSALLSMRELYRAT